MGKGKITKQQRRGAAKTAPKKRRGRKARGAEVKLAELELEAKRLDRELACAALFDPGSILDPKTGATLPLHEWPEHSRRALASFEEEALFETVDTGEVGPRGGVVKARVQVGVIRKVKWLTKTDAQRLAFQRLGALVERHEHLVATPEDPTDDELEMLSKLRHEVLPKLRGSE